MFVVSDTDTEEIRKEAKSTLEDGDWRFLGDGECDYSNPLDDPASDTDWLRKALGATGTDNELILSRSCIREYLSKRWMDFEKARPRTLRRFSDPCAARIAADALDEKAGYWILDLSGGASTLDEYARRMLGSMAPKERVVLKVVGVLDYHY
jgi:uncharacterized NAD(P)/FAD-binding protein YdhS